MTAPLARDPARRVKKISLILLDNDTTICIETRDQRGNLMHLFEEKPEVGLALWARLLALLAARMR